jgi:hypothetical protein
MAKVTPLKMWNNAPATQIRAIGALSPISRTPKMRTASKGL